MMKNSGITVRAATKDDTIKITDMLREEGLSIPLKDDKETVSKHWERLWESNPFYNITSKEKIIGWVLLDDDRVVGFFGVMPRIYYLNGKQIEVYVGSNLGISKPYRKFAYLICEPFFNSFSDSIKITTTAIDSTGKIFKMFKGHPYSNPDIINTVIVPLKFDNLIIAKFKSLNQYEWGLKFFLKSFNIFNPNRLISILHKSPFKVEQIDAMPKDFNVFWHKYLNISNGLIASRDIDTMNWVYKDVRNDNRKSVFLFRDKKNNEIIAYASLINEPVSSSKIIKRFKIADILYLDPGLKKSIIKFLIKFSFSMGADLLEFHLTPDINRKDIPAITFARKTNFFPVFFQTANKDLESLLQEKNFWKLSPYDGDTILG